ncbi:MAG: STAS/SEC14 domain-containing protein [Hydrogenimonas sp.]|nr:STAS/SEC14 domain-containing protein [Hydrogenimonas sp.]
MHIKSHGISIELTQSNKEVLVEFTLLGKLTHEDYETFVPFIESAVKALPQRSLNILVDMRHFEGWSLEAAWDDFKFGLQIRDDINKMAVVGNRKWEEIFTKITSWMIPGRAKFFHDKEEALAWLMSR